MKTLYVTGTYQMGHLPVVTISHSETAVLNQVSVEATLPHACPKVERGK